MAEPYRRYFKVVECFLPTCEGGEILACCVARRLRDAKCAFGVDAANEHLYAVMCESRLPENVFDPNGCL
jgi:hypothetical protein